MVTVVSLLALAGCSTEPARQAPIIDMNEPVPSSPSAAGGTYVVKPGDSLYGIARRNGVDVESLKRANNITDANHLSVGQVLQLPGSGGAVAVAPPKPTPLPPPVKPLEPVPLDQLPPANNPPAAQQPATPSVPAVTAPPATARASDANLINWNWPAQGSISQQFNTSSKGIDIAGKPGDPVLAAADGKVMYSGNGVRGLGNLVIINHSNGFITAYAHNQELLVKTGQEVKRGAKIATVGQSDTSSPMLHFEIRRQGTPVDPLQYLPAR
jgi:lipoprotein NlpD